MATNYSDLIATVIRDFDEIYSVLRAKGSQHGGSALPTSGNTGIATADYANIINSNLVKVNGLLVSDLTAPNGMLDNNTGTTNTGTVSIDYANNGISITGIKPGYYNASSILSLGATFVDLDIDSFNLSEDGKNYILTPNNSIIKSVTIAKGSVSGSATATASSVSGKVPTATVNTELTSTIVSSTNSTGAYPVTLKVTPALSGEIIATVSKDSVTPGYISSADDVTLTGNAYDISGISVAEATETYYIAKGSVSLNTDNTNITPTLTLGGLLEGTADNGYAVTTTVEDVTLTATTVPGYVTENEVTLNAESLTNAPVTKYIAKGAVSGAAANVAKPTITLSSTIAAPADYNKDVYTVTANTAAITLKHAVTEGYIRNTDVSDLTLTPDTASINIAKGSAKASISGNTISATSDYLVSTGGREFTVTSTPTISRELTEGYIKNADFTSATSTATETFHIKEGIVGTPSNTLSVTAAGFTDTDNAIRSEIFKTEKPKSGEYYTVGASSSVSITGGWIDTQTITQASNKYYVPKATFNFVETSAGASKFIQVTTGGYIPSGEIVELEGELTEADYAVVNLQLSGNEGSIVNNNLTENYYTLEVSKASIDAGYISDTNGTINPYTLKVAKGSVSNTNTVDTVAISGDITGSVSTGYTIPLNVTAGSTVVVTDGYVKNSEIMVDGASQANNTKKTITVAKSVDIDAATIAIDATAVSGNVSSSGFNFASGVTKYAVTPTIGGDNGSTLVARATKAGYVDSTYSTELNVTLDKDNAQTRYLTPGTQLTSVNGSGTVAITNNFGTNQTGDYTISLTNPENTQISVEGTLTEGYYASSEELAVSGRATITGLTGNVSVKHGSVTVNTASAELSVSSTAGLTLHNESAGLDGYYELTLEAESLLLDASTVAGYVKAADVTNSASSVTNTSSTKYFISKYVNSNIYKETGNYAAAIDGFGTPKNANVESWVQNDEVVVQESDSMVIETAGKYVEKNIEVRLAPDAAGSAVRNELYKLQQRLLGNNVKDVPLA